MARSEAGGAADDVADDAGSTMAGRTVLSAAVPGDTSPVSLAGIVLSDAASGLPLDLGTGPEKALLTVIRHRH